MTTNSRAEGEADQRFDSLEGYNCDKGSRNPL